MPKRLSVIIVAAALAAAGPMAASAQIRAPHSGSKEFQTNFSYAAMVERLIGAIKKTKMDIVARASASQGAKSIGVKIPGNTVIMVFRPDFAVRMLRASVAAGIEAPLRFYVTEGVHGLARLTYRRPSSVFAPYGSLALDRMALQLDRIFGEIVKDALARRPPAR